jgi:hypothetical protein
MLTIFVICVLSCVVLLLATWLLIQYINKPQMNDDNDDTLQTLTQWHLLAQNSSNSFVIIYLQYNNFKANYL